MIMPEDLEALLWEAEAHLQEVINIPSQERTENDIRSANTIIFAIDKAYGTLQKAIKEAEELRKV